MTSAKKTALIRRLVSLQDALIGVNALLLHVEAQDDYPSWAPSFDEMVSEVCDWADAEITALKGK